MQQASLIKKILTGIVVFILLTIFIYRCIEPFDAIGSSKGDNLLVVEGYINAGPGETTIKLSRTVSINEEHQLVMETKAKVLIENDKGESFHLSEIANGIYKSENLDLPIEDEYRLHIKLLNGDEYQSYFLPVTVTPVIDSLSWEAKDQLYVYVNSHDDLGITKYYKWQFEEIWQIQSIEPTFLKYENGVIIERPEVERFALYNCWGHGKSHELLFSSTTNQINDVLNYALIKVPAGSDKISILYSVSVRQRALNQDEFEYLSIIQKNTNQVGSFFDPLPSQLFGNIQCLTNPSQVVIGYVGSYTTEEKMLRIFKSELPFDLTRPGRCTEVLLNKNNLDTLEYCFGSGRYLPINFVGDSLIRGNEPICLDCTLRGSSVKPGFWQ